MCGCYRRLERTLCEWRLLGMLLLCTAWSPAVATSASARGVLKTLPISAARAVAMAVLT